MILLNTGTRSRHPLEVAEELMDGLGLGMLVQDQGGRVLQANAAGQLLLGLDLAQMSGADRKHRDAQLLDDCSQCIHGAVLALGGGA